MSSTAAGVIDSGVNHNVIPGWTIRLNGAGRQQYCLSVFVIGCFIKALDGCLDSVVPGSDFMNVDDTAGVETSNSLTEVFGRALYQSHQDAISLSLSNLRRQNACIAEMGSQQMGNTILFDILLQVVKRLGVPFKGVNHARPSMHCHRYRELAYTCEHIDN